MVRAVMLVCGLMAACGAVCAQAEPSIMITAAADSGANDARDAATPPWPEPVPKLTIQLPGMSHHFDPPVDEHGQEIPGREFNERNWGIGVQIERLLGGDWSGWVSKSSLGVMKDSLDAMGAYAGQTWQKRLLDGETYNVDLGGGVFVFYRTLQFDGPHQWVPGALPVLSVTHKAWGLGMNMVVVPRVKLSGGTLPNVIYAQFTKSL